ncbi:type II toxin-antitoxin system RelE/ParE family toxin [Riemerella anatipestifer]|uniref:type II toxin-antitoxin system RelE/ParE family toxin n=1 Tax=Riemerella anatipestifer TaxID=34085 RepID=UPI0009A1C65D|nr:type II toxin-antitoxin system RelE/ParE family toxin [Riemerella anatipestifer]MBO4234786.1 type II toxin-antitoxin system RelE/ParE family toxin [Riemerella anatipestifer]MCO4304954.1 type II toxin-antitoxin system RelE/ParE family toxin [Riemerella anatipestifer]MCO7353881.1 type II toxin-antitoxin system RelE/ParE family toxin [Riemerella anatipestifer]MCQ4040370.1 type II toxin-antitoxin system RelE/ParE family toxin [Riemerella anatipestifer]MCT6761979.1 type II toxin-antitoxin system
MTYRISKKANLDIERIWLYTYENWSIEQADRYLNLIMDEIEYLAQNPKSGTDYGHIREGYFRSRVKSHFIFYKIDYKKKEVQIIRVLHRRMDIESRLDE